ncbi:MAG TPA: LPXTG cell wall anchor domain-containing protein [Edaphobacter sp.]|nr:LPXTG cell wall anchor domain-containing protein [Edaphobacter sp.]
MNLKSSWAQIGPVLAVGAIYLVFALSISAQVQTTTDTEHGQATKDVTVERGEVVMVDGNDLIVKRDDGQILHFPSVPESARVTVDGQQLSVHDLKPGMKLQRTITTTTTPKMITTTESVTGTVWHVTPPTSVILTLQDGTNQQFRIPRGQKFMINGRETDARDLRRGMTVTATRVVEEPITVVDQQRKVTGSMPPPPPAPPANTPILIVVSRPTPAPAETAAEPAPEKLPKTGSIVPSIGLLGILLLGASFGLTMVRKSRSVV